jgi:hypothetical protein
MTDHSVHAFRTRKLIVWVARAIGYLVYVYLVVVEVILVLGFFLLLFGANPTAGFTQWVYRNLDRIMEPFRGMFTPIELGTTSGNVPSIVETSVLFAMIVYALAVIAISALTSWLTGRMRDLDAAEAEAQRRQRDDQLVAQGYDPTALPSAPTAVPRPHA